MTSTTKLPALKRFITTHDSSGKAIFSDAISEDNKFQEIPGAFFGLAYTTKGFPVDLNDDKDIEAYRATLQTPPGIVISNGTVLRFVDVAPGHDSPMHRTVSLDYGVVIEGEVELVLDSGETRRMKRGDVAVQRGTMHQWKNPGTEWARLMFVLQHSQPVVVAGKALEEDYGTMQGVPEST